MWKKTNISHIFFLWNEKGNEQFIPWIRRICFNQMNEFSTNQPKKEEKLAKSEWEKPRNQMFIKHEWLNGLYDVGVFHFIQIGFGCCCCWDGRLDWQEFCFIHCADAAYDMDNNSFLSSEIRCYNGCAKQKWIMNHRPNKVETIVDMIKHTNSPRMNTSQPQHWPEPIQINEWMKDSFQ